MLPTLLNIQLRTGYKWAKNWGHYSINYGFFLPNCDILVNTAEFLFGPETQERKQKIKNMNMKENQCWNGLD